MKHVYLEDKSNFNIIKYFITCDRQCIRLTFIRNPIFRRQNVNLEEWKEYCLLEWQTGGDRERQGETGKPACQLSIKTRNRVGKRVEGCKLKRIERIHHPYFTETTFGIPPSLFILVVWPFHSWSLCIFVSRSSSVYLIPSPSHPRALFSYQIESLYFASSIISFINLRAFRTLWGPLKAAW